MRGCGARETDGGSCEVNIVPGEAISGNKSQSEADFAIPDRQLSFRHMYNSVAADTNLGLGQGRTHTYAVPLFDAGEAHAGAVTLIQLFGSALNLNLHFHAPFIDGVFSLKSHGELRFHRAKRHDWS